jgi:capsular exopolysaccharide synthesis family protein
MSAINQGLNDNSSRHDEELHLAEYWAIVVKHRRLIVSSIVVSLVIGLVACVLTRSTYMATTVLNIERDKSTPFDVPGTTPYSPYEPEFVPTQTRLMKSREVAQRAADRLRLAENPEFVVRKSGFFGSSRKEGETAARSAAAAARVQAGVTVSPIRGTNLVELSFVATSPKLAADIANALADGYIDWNVESKYLVVGQATRFLGTQIEQLRGEIQSKERQLQAYGRANDIVSTDPSGNVSMQKLQSFNTDYAAAVGDRVGKEARYYELQNAKPDAIADSLSNGLVTQLRNDQARLEREYAEKLNLYKPEWPAMQQLKAQIDKGRQHLSSVVQETVAKARDAAYTDYMTAARREQSLKGVVQGEKTQAMALNTNAVEYNNLKTEVETKRTLLDSLLKKQAETEVTSRLRGERVSNIRVVDRALPPPSRFRPSYRLNGLLAIFLGSAFGIGLAFLLEYLDRSLRSTEQVEKYLRLPALGIIPAVGGTGSGYGYGYGSHGYGLPLKKRQRATKSEETVAIELLPHTQPRSTVAESYRAFRTALLLSRAGGVKTIVITSSLPGEGKTSTALNLAVVLGQLGKKVLLVAADLHKPRLHEALRISNRVGLVSILAENLDLSAAIVRSSVPNVFVVPSGPSSPNPSGLLSSPAMAKFLEEAASNFDYIVIDTPPVGPVADAILLGYQADGVVLCARGGITPRDVVAKTRDRLIQAHVRVLGVLINNLDEESGGYGRYYSYYGYGRGKSAYGDEVTPSRAVVG